MKNSDIVNQLYEIAATTRDRLGNNSSCQEYARNVKKELEREGFDPLLARGFIPDIREDETEILGVHCWVEIVITGTRFIVEPSSSVKEHSGEVAVFIGRPEEYEFEHFVN